MISEAAKQGALGAGLPAPVAGGIGLLADVATPDARSATRAVTEGPGVARGVADLLQDVPYRLGGAPEDGVLGIRRGQRFRMPTLTPEQQAQRARDGAAEQRVFDAIARLWRQGPDGEAAADDLRFLAVGKGEAGEQAARDYLAGKGLEDALPAPPPSDWWPPDRDRGRPPGAGDGGPPSRSWPAGR